MFKDTRVLLARCKTGVETARIVKPSWLFAMREVLDRIFGLSEQFGKTSTYALHGRTPLALDHSGTEAYILHEMFCRHQYEIPHEVRLALGSAPLSILDLGGNVGYFAVWTYLTFPYAKVTAFEADPANAERYQGALRVLEKSDWQLIRAFAGSQDGEVAFSSGRGGLSMRSLDGSGIIVPSVDVFPFLDGVDFVKMDIEGGEWEILLDPRFGHQSLKAIVLEYHADMCPSAQPREMVEEIAIRND